MLVLSSHCMMCLVRLALLLHQQHALLAGDSPAPLATLTISSATVLVLCRSFDNCCKGSGRPCRCSYIRGPDRWHLPEGTRAALSVSHCNTHRNCSPLALACAHASEAADSTASCIAPHIEMRCHDARFAAQCRQTVSSHNVEVCKCTTNEVRLNGTEILPSSALTVDTLLTLARPPDKPEDH